VTYTCPFCGGLLLAMTEHVLLAPEGEVERRRHAHTDCVRAARARGELRPPTSGARRSRPRVWAR